MEILLLHKADVEALGITEGIKQTLLQGAAIRGYVMIARRVQEYEAGPGNTEENGRNVLHHAAQNGKEEVARALLE